MNQDCLHILMLLYVFLYTVLAYLMLFAALSNAVCLYNAFFPFISANAFVLMLCLGLFSYILFISCVNLHHAQCF